VWSDSAAATGGSSVPYVVVGAALAMGAIVVLAARSAWDAADDGLRWDRDARRMGGPPMPSL